MNVTPINRKFGKYMPGETFTLPDKAARLFIKVGKLRQVDEAPAANTYQTRMMQAAPVAPAIVIAEPIADAVETSEPEAAPYGYKLDGTPRKRPGRAPTTD